MKKRKGFTLIELLVVISIIALLIGILLPALAEARKNARRMKGNSQVRGIHQNMVAYADANGENFPGLNRSGAIVADDQDDTGNSGDGDHPAARYWIMLAKDYFSPEYIISPSETLTEWSNPTGVPTADEVECENGTQHYSFAMSKISDGDGTTLDTDSPSRVTEWGQTINTQAPIMSDRNQEVTGTITTDDIDGDVDAVVNSIHTDDSIDDWLGSIGWNDNHVELSTDNVVKSRLGSGGQNDEDNVLVEGEAGSTTTGQYLYADSEACMVWGEPDSAFE